MLLSPYKNEAGKADLAKIKSQKTTLILLCQME